MLYFAIPYKQVSYLQKSLLDIVDLYILFCKIMYIILVVSLNVTALGVDVKEVEDFFWAVKARILHPIFEDLSSWEQLPFLILPFY